MSHGITKTDRVGLNKANGLDWHGLAKDIRHLIGLPVPEIFAHEKIDFETALLKIQAIDDNGVVVATNSNGHRAHVRLDTNEILAVLHKDYRIFSNKSLAELAEAFRQVDPKALTESVGTLRGGRVVFALIRLGEAVVGPNDNICQYLMLSNTHDGTGKLQIAVVSIRVLCLNTYRMAMHEIGESGISFRHDKSLDVNIERLTESLREATREAESFTTKAIAMRQAQLVDPSPYFDAVFTATFGPRPAEKKTLTHDEQVAVGSQILAQILETPSETLSKAIQEWDEKRGTIVNAWTENFQADETAAGTLWGAFNAVTEYHDHQRGRGNIQERTMTPARVHSNLMGASHQDKVLAYRIALDDFLS